MDDHLALWDPPSDFIDKSKLAGIPRHGIGRVMKVSKEEIVALLTALDLFASGAYDPQCHVARDLLKQIVSELKGLPAACEIIDDADGETLPNLAIRLDEPTLGRTAFDVCRALRQGKPPVYVSHGRLAEGILMINPLHLNESRTAALAQRLREELV
jgi:D-glucosaminate-6-phosphate ammonia-lyase